MFWCAMFKIKSEQFLLLFYRCYVNVLFRCWVRCSSKCTGWPLWNIIIYIVVLHCAVQGLQEKFCKAEQACFVASDRLRLLSKLRIWGLIKPLVNFHRCFISCAAECPDNYTLYKAVTNIIQKFKWILHNYFSK